MAIYAGCAGWSLRKEFAHEFLGSGTHLERYATRLNAVEINSSFYRPHQVKSYQRWADSTPSDFRFAVKAPKQITHVNRLIGSGAALERFLLEVGGLGGKLGPILVQLPPSLAFNAAIVRGFLGALRDLTNTVVVCEPRHVSWFTPEAEAMLSEFFVDRVAADPAVVPFAAEPGGRRQDCYFRWHGSPRTYYSRYDSRALGDLARRLQRISSQARNVWCIFDNTAEGAATANALELREMLNLAQ